MDRSLPLLGSPPRPAPSVLPRAGASRWQFGGVHGSEGRLVRCPAASLFSPLLFLMRKGRSESMPSRPPLSACSIPATAEAPSASATAKAPVPMSLLRRPLFLLVLVASLGIVAASGRAAPTTDAAAFVSDLVGKAMHSLSDKALSDEQREKQFRAMLDSKFDMPRISRFVLGRYWTTASDQDKQNFQKLFEDYVVRAQAGQRLQGRRHRRRRREHAGDAARGIRLGHPAQRRHDCRAQQDAAGAARQRRYQPRRAAAAAEAVRSAQARVSGL